MLLSEYISPLKMGLVFEKCARYNEDV